MKLGKGVIVLAIVAPAAITSAALPQTRTEQGSATVRNAQGEMMLVSRPGGVLVEQLVTHRAGAAPVRTGDVIAGVDGRAVRTPEDLLSRFRDDPRTRSVRLSILRNGRTVDVAAASVWFIPFMTPPPPATPATPGS